MQQAELIKYIENPALLDKQSVKQLQKLVEDFPYFQAAHMLLSLASKKWDPSVYQQSLKKTAIVVTNRAHLFKLIHQAEETLQAAGIEKTENQHSDPAESIVNNVENSSHELNILKATEVSAAQEQAIAEVAVPVAASPVIEEATAVQKTVLAPEEILEKEIQSGVVNSFVEKEILKTPELHHPKPKEDPESFVEWLTLLKKNNGQNYQQINEQLSNEKIRAKNPKTTNDSARAVNNDPGQAKKEKNRALIDKIIESSPGIIRSKEDQKFFAAENKAKESLLENEHLVTETLAKIYALQGSVNKAVRAYEILSLKFPQKSAYFATLIQKLKSNQ